jgi:white-opaque regulator 2
MQPAYAYHLSAPQGPLPAPPLAAAAHIHPSVVVSLPPLSAMDAIAPMQHHQQSQQHEQHQHQQDQQQFQHHHQGHHLPSPSPTHSQPPASHMAAVSHMAGGMYQHMPVTIPYSTAQLLNTPGGAHVVRYSIPNPHMMISGGRHKKEIKRRTKTGCLTCRKRRIKVRCPFTATFMPSSNIKQCDELHPVCRNCQKSKRNCAGYDPGVKAQSNGGSPPVRSPIAKSESSSYPASSASRVDSLYSSSSAAPSHHSLYSLSMAHSGAHMSAPVVQAVMPDSSSPGMYAPQHAISVHGRSHGTAY